MKNRIIIHIDMDAFFASIEQRDNKSLRGKPVIVGRDKKQRGVVATCSYEARKYGIHSAMSMSTAQKLCPHGIVVEPRYNVYREVSNKIHEIFLTQTDIMEPIALDEAYLDVTDRCANYEEAQQVALKLKQQIWNELSLTCSAGVSYNKFLAKLASEHNKPNGFFMIKEEEAQKILDSLPIGDFLGVGKVTEQKLKNYGINTGRDLRQYSLKELTAFFQKRGYFLYQLARGIDERDVKSQWVRKSIGHEVTFETDLEPDKSLIIEKLDPIAQYISAKLIENEKCGYVVTLVIKNKDFVEITKRIRVNTPIYAKDDIMNVCRTLLKQVTLSAKIRLLGIRISKLQVRTDGYENLTIFDFFK